MIVGEIISQCQILCGVQCCVDFEFVSFDFWSVVEQVQIVVVWLEDEGVGLEIIEIGDVVCDVYGQVVVEEL